MPNALTPTGIITKTQAELVQEYTDGMKLIYGDDVNLSPDSPDGQAMMITIQAILDMQDLLKQIFTSFDPDEAIGTTLDRRLAFNGIERKDGTYTLQYIDVTTSGALTLQGIDDNNDNLPIAYKVSDNNGNNWVLLETEEIEDPGIYNRLFRAEFPGAVITTPNTINVPVSIVLGVESINNPTNQFSLGSNEESDVKAKIRRQKSVSINSQGYAEALEAELENTEGITFARVFENDTSEIDEDGLPPHSIWVIVEGTAEDVTIATAIYKKRNAGATMYGDQSYTITQRSGNKKVIRWDLVEPEAFFIKMNLDPIDGLTEPNINLIKSEIARLLVPNVNETLNINTIASLVRQIDPNALATNIGLGKSAVGPFTPVLEPTLKKNRFIVNQNNIIVLPMQINPPEILSIEANDTRLFVASGGYGTITYSIYENFTGSTISPTGLYTAGTTPGIDTVRASDTQGNHIDALVEVQ